MLSQLWSLDKEALEWPCKENLIMIMECRRMKMKECKQHEWTGYIIVFCKKCKILKDFFDGFPKK